MIVASWFQIIKRIAMQCHPSLQYVVYLYVMEHFYLQCSSILSLVRYGFYLFWKSSNIMMLSFGWLKRDCRPQECCLHSKFFYLSGVSRTALSLAVNFQSDALSSLVPFNQIKKRENHPWRSITFSKSDIPPWVVFTFF